MSVGHLYIIFGKMSIQDLCPFLNQLIFLLLSFMHNVFIFVLNYIQLYKALCELA